MCALDIQPALQENIENIQTTFHHTSDLVVRRFKPKESAELCLIYLDSIIDSVQIHDDVLKPLLENLENHESPIDLIGEKIIQSADVQNTNKFKDVIDGIIQGSTIVLIEGSKSCIMIPSVKWEERSIEEAIGERSPRGPVIGFTEKMKTNINLIRGTLKTPNLCVESLELGEEAKTSVSVIYLKGTVDKDILKEVKRRLQSINIKFLFNSLVVEDALEGKPATMFSLVRSTERIDSVVSSIEEGRVVVMVDGIPHAIVAPSLFIDYFQSSDEYHTKFGKIINRPMRILGFLIGLYLPGIYVALASFHQDDLSDELKKLLITENEIIPTFWEIMILLFLVRILIDATFRLPKSTIVLVSLVGTIVIGQTAVEAKLLHSFSLIVIGVTILSSFLVIYRGLAAAENTFRFIFVLIGHFFGFQGLIIASTLLVLYLVNLKSIGVPYLAPIIPFRIEELKDTLVRGNLQKLINSKHTYPEKDD